MGTGELLGILYCRMLSVVSFDGACAAAALPAVHVSNVARSGQEPVVVRSDGLSI